MMGGTLLGLIEGAAMVMTPHTPPLTAPEIPDLPQT
jgi:hypothetical protein